MDIAIIGSGNLATNIGKAFLASGHNIIQVFSRTEDHARDLAQTLAASHTSCIDDISCDADVYVISVKDSAMGEVIEKMCIGRESKVFLHTAGSVGIDIFSSHALHYGVLYPMQTFSKTREVDFKKIPVFIEWNDAIAEQTIKTLASSISDKITVLSSSDRKFLHLAAVFGCNFANHCFTLAADIMEGHGMNFEMLLPLIDETVAKLHTLHPKEAQTGPAVRYGENVIARQCQLLDDTPIMKDIYTLMSNSIHNKATKG